MNAPDAFENFKIPEGKSKVEQFKIEKIPNTSVFTIYLEDHTFGNAVKMMLLRNPKVRFVAFRKPHPLENKIEIKIQTNGDITPIAAFKEALKNLKEDIDDCKRQFEKQLKNSMDVE